MHKQKKTQLLITPAVKGVGKNSRSHALPFSFINTNILIGLFQFSFHFKSVRSLLRTSVVLIYFRAIKEHCLYMMSIFLFVTGDTVFYKKIKRGIKTGGIF